jgi:nitrate/nitrite transport system substrate-binding protein
VMRGDLYLEAMKEIGVTDRAQDDSTFALFDGKTFDPANPEAYGTSFDVHSMKG